MSTTQPKPQKVHAGRLIAMLVAAPVAPFIIAWGLLQFFMRGCRLWAQVVRHTLEGE